MKKTKKGLTLVEVLVSVAVFAVIMLALTSTYIGMRNLSRRQEQYVRLEMVCYDINYYWDAYGEDWATKYLASNEVGEGVKKDGEDYHIFLNTEFKPASGTSNYTYKVICCINKNDELIIKSVETSAKDRVYIKDLNCGTSSEYTSTGG